MPPTHPLPLIIAFCLAALMSPASAQAEQPQSFSCAISTYTLKAGGPAYEVCVVNASSSNGNFLSMQWFTGTFDKPYGSESVLISM